MSFIKENQQGWKIGDWLVLILLIGGGVGGWFYYTQSKSSSLERFSEADKLFSQGNYTQAMDLYNELQNAAWKNDSLDSLLYLRMAQLNEWKSTEEQLYWVVDSLWAAGDTAQATARLVEIPTGKFLSPEQHLRLDPIRAQRQLQLQTEQPTDSATAEAVSAAE